MPSFDSTSSDSTSFDADLSDSTLGASFGAESFDTLCIRAGGEAEAGSDALVPSVCSSTTFAQSSPGLHPRYCYGRTGNPTRERLEEALALLEGARYARTFASGLAAVDTLLHTLESGAHVVASQDLYGGCYRQFTKVWSRFGVQFSFVDTVDTDAVAKAITPATRLLWLETPSNPLLRVTPIAATCALARAAGIRTVVDNTFATPLLQRPIALGADIVLHSTTKYIGGHCDVLGGALITDDPAIAAEIAFLQNAIGAVPSPADAALLLRGIRTLALRVDRHCSSALAIARALEGTPGIARVDYPGLESHESHRLAASQMSAFGGIVSLQLAGGREAVERFSRATKLWTLAESLGGFKSLWCHPPTMTHASVDAAQRARVGITDGTVRLSVGLEDPRDLIADLRQAINASVGVSACSKTEVFA